jgi:LPXTG-motif cell wall-anchored protein
VYAGQYGYGTHLDSDYDGIGCEEHLGTYAPTAQPVAYASDSGKLAYTGVTVQPLVAWGAALALAGGWLLLSGRRRI